MNYNFVAPWFGSFSSNRGETAVPMFTAFKRLTAPAKAYAKRNPGGMQFNGLLLSTFIANFESLTLDRGQKGNAALTAMLYMMHYKDHSFLRKAPTRDETGRCDSS